MWKVRRSRENKGIAWRVSNSIRSSTKLYKFWEMNCLRRWKMWKMNLWMMFCEQYRVQKTHMSSVTKVLFSSRRGTPLSYWRLGYVGRGSGRMIFLFQRQYLVFSQTHDWQINWLRSNPLWIHDSIMSIPRIYEAAITFFLLLMEVVMINIWNNHTLAFSLRGY